MTVAATDLYINTVGVTFTPAGGSASPLNKVTSSSIDGGISNVTFAGDGDSSSTFNGTVMQDPTVTLAGGNVGSLMASLGGAVGTLEFVWPDARNGHGAGSYAIQWTLDNAVVAGKSASAQHAQVATGQNVFQSFSSDGTTLALSFAVL